MKRLKSGGYINFDHILEIGVVPFYEDGEVVFIIKYWDILGDEYQIPGWFRKEQEAQDELDLMMSGHKNR